MIRYYINLDQSVGRRSHVEALFRELNLSVHRVSAVDGRKLSAKQLSNLRPSLRERHFWLKEMTPGEIGAYLSHLKTWKMFLETREEWALILEDDPFFREDVAEFITETSWIPEGIDLIQLTAKKKPGIDIRAPEFLSIHEKKARLLEVWDWGNLGALGYLVNRKAAQALIDVSDKILGPVDDLLFLYASPLRKEIVAWGLSPSVIYYDDELESDVGLDKKNNKTPKLANPVGYLERKLIMMKHKAKCSREGIKDHR